MEVKVCRHCKKMFQYVAGEMICPKCKQIQEDQFQKVKEYLRENPGAAMNTVSEETKVTVKLIQKFLKEGRLEVVPGSPISLTCEKCGAPVLSGRYCNKCKSDLVNQLSDVVKDIKSAHEPDKEIAKMRFLQSDKI